MKGKTKPKKKTHGRPPAPAADVYSFRYCIKLRPADRAAIKEQAKEAGFEVEAVYFRWLASEDRKRLRMPAKDY